jgi:hypothetical protein
MGQEVAQLRVSKMVMIMMMMMITYRQMDLWFAQ